MRIVTAVMVMAVLVAGQTTAKPGPRPGGRAAATAKGANAAPPSAEALVRQAAQAVQTMPEFIVGHQVDVKVEMAKYAETMHSYLTTWVKRPQLVRIEAKTMPQSETVVADGAGMWIYRDADGEYWRTPGQPPAELLANAFPSLARELSTPRLPQAMRSARLVGEETLSVGERHFPCYVVEVTVDPQAAEGTLANHVVRLWLSERYKVPLKVTATFLPSRPGERAKQYTDFATRFEPLAKIPEATWAFIPPKNSHPRPGTPVPGLE